VEQVAPPAPAFVAPQMSRRPRHDALPPPPPRARMARGTASPRQASLDEERTSEVTAPFAIAEPTHVDHRRR
jgi:hypothetical protein